MRVKVLYLCDGRVEGCEHSVSCGMNNATDDSHHYCYHTKDPKHAINGKESKKELEGLEHNRFTQLDIKDGDGAVWYIERSRALDDG